MSPTPRAIKEATNKDKGVIKTTTKAMPALMESMKSRVPRMVMTPRFRMFTACGRLYQRGLRGGCEKE